MGSEESKEVTDERPVPVEIKKKKKKRLRKGRSAVDRMFTASKAPSAFACDSALMSLGESVALCFGPYERCPIRSLTIDEACADLRDFENCRIHAIWLVSRPVNSGPFAGKVKHWSVKIQADDYLLVTLDFLKTKDLKEAKFAVNKLGDEEQHIDDLLHYYVAGVEHKYAVVSKALPRIDFLKAPLICDESFYAESHSSVESGVDWATHIPLEDIPRVIEEALESAGQMVAGVRGESDGGDLLLDADWLQPVKFKKRVRDVLSFLCDWYAQHMYYSVFDDNCQKFAFQLFKHIVVDTVDDDYAAELKKAAKQLQAYKNYYDTIRHLPKVSTE